MLSKDNLDPPDQETNTDSNIDCLICLEVLVPKVGKVVLIQDF
jgi:hypothetical protein